MRFLIVLAVLAASVLNARGESHPALPLPLEEVPLDLRYSIDSTELEAPRIATRACGELEIETGLLDDDPTQGGRGVARALRHPDVTLAIMRCHDELARADVKPSRVHSIAFGDRSNSKHVDVFAWAATELPPTSAWGKDASAWFPGRTARCFGRKTDKPCNELSTVFVKLRDGVWLNGQINDVQALINSPRGKARGAAEERELLAATRTLTAPSVSLDALDVWAWNARLDLSKPLPSYSAPTGTTTVRTILARDAAHAEEIERTLTSARDEYLRTVEPHVKKATARCTGCKTAYERYIHVTVLRSAAHARAVTIERDGRVVRVSYPVVDVPQVAAAARALDAEQAKRAKKVTALLDAWRKGRVPTMKDLRAIGGTVLVRTVEDLNK